MTEVRGTYLDGCTSEARPGQVIWEEGPELVVRTDDGTVDRRVPLAELGIDPPLGRTPRCLRLPDGARFDTGDHEAMARLERAAGRNRGGAALHLLESRWRWVAAAAVVVALAMWAFLVFGLPWLADRATRGVPTGITEALGRMVLARLDDGVLDSTGLSEEIRRAVQAEAVALARETGAPHLRVVFRRAPRLGPNAFALPGGTVVITDALVDLAGSVERVLPVVAHEAAHVAERHALRKVVQQAGVVAALALFAGDVTSVAGLAGAFPAALLESRYSRSFESEADRIAARWLLASGRPLDPMIGIYRDLGRVGGFEAPEALSSHPDMARRIAALEALGQR